MLGVSETTVFRNLRSYNIYVRTRSEAESGKLNPNYGKTWGPEIIERMSIPKRGSKNPRFGVKLSDKQKLAISKRVSGKNNPMYGRIRELSPVWTGGKYSIYDSYFNKELKEIIYKIFYNTCYICRKQSHNKNHDVHHINYNKFDSSKNNLILLCNKCHTKTNFNRWYWFNLFVNYWTYNNEIHFGELNKGVFA